MAAEALSWMEGQWVGRIGEDAVEETWGRELAGQRHGMFRWLKNGKPWIYEWLLMGEFDGVVQIRLKHFGPDAVGWEERGAWTEFTLQTVNGQRAEFVQTNKPNGPRLIYERTDDAMRTWFESDDGKVPVKGVFEYELVSKSG